MRRAKNINNLTDKQVLFCKEFIIDMNGKQAAIRAGYTPNSAEQHASRLLSNGKVQSYIAILKDKRSERTQITADMVLTELAKIGFSDLSQFVDENYQLKPLSEIEGKSAAIASLSVNESYTEYGTHKTVNFKLHDKLSALEKIAKHIGFFEKDNEQLKTTNVNDTVIKVYNTGVPLSKNESDIE